MAATIPYDPTSSMAPTGTLPEIHPQVNPDAFGAGIGEAIRGLGGSIAHVGDELFARGLALQKLQNETAAMQADTDYMEVAGKLHAEYNALQGKDRVERFDGYTKDLKAAREQIRASLGNDEARRMYDSRSVSTLGHSIFNGAGAAATAQKDWTRGTIDAQDSMVIKTVDDNPESDTAVQSALNTLERNSHTRAGVNGWGEEQRLDDLGKRKSLLVLQRIMATGKKDPDRAAALLDQFSDQLYGDDKRKAENFVQTSVETRGAVNISAGVMNKVRDAEDTDKPMTMREAVDMAEAEAKKKRPDDLVYQQAVRQTTERQFGVFKQIRQQDLQENKMVLGSGLIGLSTQDGKLPTNEEELRANPRTAQALDWAKQNRPDLYREVRTALAKNAKGDVTETPERRDRYNTLKGMADSFPADFLDVDLWKENITIQWKQELQDRKFKVIKGQGGDPRYMNAMRQLEPSLRAVGITMQSKDEYLKFKGALMGAMDAYQEREKKMPPRDEIDKIGAQLIRDRTPFSWVNPLTWTSDRTYAVTIPAEDQAKITEAFKARNNTDVDPTEQQIRKYYFMKQYIDLWSKPKSTTKPPR